MNTTEQQLRQQLEATERANSQMLEEIKRLNAASGQLRVALAPFLAIARACVMLHDHEPIAARSVPGGNNRVIALDVRDFRALAKAVEALDDRRRDSDEIALVAKLKEGE